MIRIFSIIVSNTLRRGLRKRFVPALCLLCVFIMFLSLILGQLSLNEAERLTVNFGLAALQISLVVTSVLFGAFFISNDLEKKILLTILTRPLSPWVFFLSRWVGLALLIFFVLFILSITLTGFFIYQGVSLDWNLLQTFLGFYFESLLFLGFVLFFSSYTGTFFVLLYSLSLFIVGHSFDSINYLFQKTEHFVFFILPLLIPDLNRVNWKSAVVYGDQIPFQEFALSSAYIFCWLGFILALSLYFFEKREYN